MSDVALSDKEARQRIADLLWLTQQFKRQMEMSVTLAYDAKRELDAILSDGRRPIQEVNFE